MDDISYTCVLKIPIIHVLVNKITIIIEAWPTRHGALQGGQIGRHKEELTVDV